MTPRALFTGVAILTATLVAAAAGNDETISVRETDGAYVVTAHFSVPEPAAVVRNVLTDYESIPRFMPDVRLSRVLDRGEGYVRVEQEAVSKFMMLSRTVHLVLDVTQESETIRFRDRCGRSFRHYEGSWIVAEHGDRTDVDYELTATPAFSVPGFVLRRLLDRDARVMIERLRTEIGARAATR